MSFKRTLEQLRVCYEKLSDHLPPQEEEARAEMIMLCKDICIESEENASIDSEEVVDGILQSYEDTEDDSCGFSIEEY